MSAALKERLKRSRPRFVSPLLTNAKKPRLTADAPVGKLNFSGCEHQVLRPHFHCSCDNLTQSHLSPQTDREDDKRMSEECESSDTKRTDELSCSKDGSSSMATEGDSGQLQLLLAEKAALEKELKEKEEKLRKLRMVKMYHAKVIIPSPTYTHIFSHSLNLHSTISIR